MRNFKISIDISDFFLELTKYDTTEYTNPFMLMFVEAENPDGACVQARLRIIRSVMHNGDTLENRIFCQKIKKQIRIDRIYAL